MVMCTHRSAFEWLDETKQEENTGINRLKRSPTRDEGISRPIPKFCEAEKLVHRYAIDQDWSGSRLLLLTNRKNKKYP